MEDKGEGVCFNVYVYNVQPGITINYATGESWLSGEKVETSKPTETQKQTESVADGEGPKYILNTNTKKIHRPTCSSAQSTKEENKQEYNGSYQELIDGGYTACGICDPVA